MYIIVVLLLLAVILGVQGYFSGVVSMSREGPAASKFLSKPASGVFIGSYEGRPTPSSHRHRRHSFLSAPLSALKQDAVPNLASVGVPSRFLVSNAGGRGGGYDSRSAPVPPSKIDCGDGDVSKEDVNAVRDYVLAVESDVETSAPRAGESSNREIAGVGGVTEGEEMAILLNPEQKARTIREVPVPSKKSSQGLSHSQEIMLGEVIQRGVKILSVKKDLEKRAGGPVTAKEWSQACGLTKSEIRRGISKYRLAKNALVVSNLGLIHAVINRSVTTNARSREELFQEGSLGLLRAAELFDPTKGLRFSTYATIWIKGNLSNSRVGEFIQIPSRERVKWTKLVKAARAYEAEHGGAKAPVGVLAEMCGMPESDVLRLRRDFLAKRDALSIDCVYVDKTGKGSDKGFYPLANDKSMMDDVHMAETCEMKADLVKAMVSNLDSRERRLLRLRYGLADGVSRSLQECASMMGLSPGRVRRINLACLEKLRAAKEIDSLQEYLLTIA